MMRPISSPAVFVGRGVTMTLRSMMLLALMGSVGCSKYGSTVQGVVRLDGQPLPRGNVVFSPDGGSKGPTASGRIDETGRYELRTGNEDSLPPGPYAITVVAHAVPVVPKEFASGPPPIPPRLTPAKYGQATSSGLRFEVQRGSNTFDIELKSK